MPKMKTRKAVAKRFAVTGTGKIVRRHAFKGHLMMRKGPAQSRRLAGEAVVTGEYASQIKRNMPYAF